MTPDMPTHHEPHLSAAAANQITRHECEPELAEFIAAIGMSGRVSTARAALLLEHIIKQSMSEDSVLIADQMLVDKWESALAAGDTVQQVSERIYQFLATDHGIRLYNFFVKIFAKTSTAIYD